MLIYEENHYQKMNTFTSSTFNLDEAYYLKNFGPDAKELLGPNNAIPFDEIGHTDEDKEELRAFLKGVKEDKVHRVIATLNDRENRPRLMDIKGQYINGQENCYEITIWDLENTECDYGYYRDLTWKYRVMIGLSGLTFFDYDEKENIISFYRYVSRKSVRQYYGTFEEFEADLLKSVDANEHNLANAHKLIEQLKEMQSSVETIVHGNFLGNHKKSQRLHFRAQFDGMNGHRRMYGVVTNMSETEEDVPFYMTTAGIDSMTGLLNKRSLVEYTEDILSNKATAERKHYMIILDMDDFKIINDSYGHQVGDKAIIMLARTLVDVVKDDGIIGRYGGDEFYILTDRVNDEEELRGMLRRIKTTVESNALTELGISDVHLSMGVSSFPEDGKTFTDLMYLADKCLYIAKGKGKNRYIIYRPAMHENIMLGAERRGLSSYDEQAKVMNKAIQEMFAEGKGAIEKHLPLIVKGFDLDNIDIFYGENLKEKLSVGKYSSEFDFDVFFENKKYMSCFDDNGLYVLNNYSNLKKPIPDIHQYLLDKKCMSMIQLVLPSAEDPKFFISFNMLNRTHKWSDAEISYLGLFGTLAYQLL